MAKFWERDGLKVTYRADGKISIEVNPAMVTAAHEFDAVGDVRVYEIDAKTLGMNIIAEIKRLPKNIKKAVKK